MRGPSSACAAVLCLAGAARGQEFVRTTVPSNPSLCLYWPQRSLTYNIDSHGYSQLPGDAGFDAIDAAFDSWRVVANTCADFQFIAGPRIPDRDIEGNTQDLILFREQACWQTVDAGDPCWTAQPAADCNDQYDCWQDTESALAITTTTVDVNTGQLLQVGTEFNAAPHLDQTSTWVFGVLEDAPCGSTNTSGMIDVQATMTHEIGHSIGLAHEINVPGSTMSPIAAPGTCMRTIDPGTGSGLCTIYPPGEPTPSCDPSYANNDPVTGITSFGCESSGGEEPSLLAAAALMAKALRGKGRRHLS
jgi:hypothetical protein